MSKKVLFIHGFASIGQGQKCLQLQHILNDEVIAPDLDHQPIQDIERLQQLIENHQIQTVIGSSLGGFYALFMALKYPVNVILINPSIHSPQTLQRHIGTVERFNGDTFQWTQQQIDELTQLLAQFQADYLSKLDQSRILMLLAKHDEVLDYRVAEQLLHDAKIVIDDVQDHRFADLQPYATLIQAWHEQS